MFAILVLFHGLLHCVRAQLNQQGSGGLWPTLQTSSTPQSIISESTQSTKSPYQLSLSPIENDLLTMNIKEGGEAKYNIHELPDNEGQPVLVEISLSLRNILEIDEHRQLVTLETTLRMYWRDPRLQVEHLLGNSSRDYILLHPDTSKFIWFPDIYIDFAKALRMPTVIVKPASLRIYRNSTVRYATQINYDVACPMNFRKYPYDTQTCKVKYESYGHTIEKMRVVWKKGFDQSKVTDNNYISLTQFEYAVFFEENYEEEIASGVYPGVIMTVLLRRKISYHLLQTYLPSGLFVIVAWLSLFLPPQSIPGRVTMAMTTLLTLAAMFGAVRQSTPKVSYVSALDIWMCTCIIFVFFALLEYVVVLCLINHCQMVGSKSVNDSNSKKSMSRANSSSPFCKKHQVSHHVGTNVSSDNNGVKICCTNDEQRTTGSPCHISHYVEPPSPKVTIKRGFLGYCCSRKSAKKRAAFEARAQYKQEQEMMLQNRFNYSAPSTLTRNPSCAICRSSSEGEVRSRYASVGTSTRVDNLEAAASKKSSQQEKQQPSDATEGKRPFQHVEKTCSIVMALLFMLFNALYWPWLLRDEDFDYAKFSATQQNQLKL